jgi:formylglycine-generating enzyme required for sulfatase activity
LAEGLGQAAEPNAAPQWPLWDGKESVADYAKRAGIKDIEMNLDLGGGVSMKLALIPAGKYIRGCNPEQVVTIEGVLVVIKEADKGCQGALMWSPRSEVTITQPFYMGVNLVTLAQYGQVMDAAAAQKAEASTRAGLAHWKAYGTGDVTVGPTTPMCTGWKQAALFCKQLSAKTGMKAWLPTEAQIEYGFPKCYVRGTIDDKYYLELVHDCWTRNFFGAPTVDPAGPVCFPQQFGLHTGRISMGGIDADGSLKPWHSGWHHTGDPKAFRVVVAVKAPGEKPPEAEKAVAAPRAKVAATGAPADPNVRVPAGCRAAAGTKAEPYTKSGWAQEIVHETTGMEMVYIPAGSFRMGVRKWVEGELGNDETPRYVPWLMLQHRVTLTKGFYMGKYEVTQAQWEKVMGNNPSIFSGKLTEDEILAKYSVLIAQHDAGPDAPVEMVSWNDCQAFCEKAGGGLRLPTEAEWEYACRAGTQGGLPDNPDELGWSIENSGGTTHPVGLKKPNAWGLYDMQGNVWEWCQDWFGRYEGSGEAVTDPTGPKGPAKPNPETRHVVRGGAWGDYRSKFHPAIRALGSYDDKGIVVTGCRLVITAANP